MNRYESLLIVNLRLVTSYQNKHELSRVLSGKKVRFLGHIWYYALVGHVAELVYAYASGAYVARLEGSSPSVPT